MKLHENTELFNEVLLKASEAYRLNPSQIEKDYWTTEILRQICQSEYAANVYFGGGTSLMKSYGLIKRFSEDLDLYVDTNESQSGQGKENALNSKVFNFIKEKNLNFKSEQPDRLSGGTRAIHLDTNSIYVPKDTKSHLLIELSISTTKRKAPTYHPSELRTINSMAMNYLKVVSKKLYNALDNKDFPCNCISPKEILCAKISRLIRVSDSDALTQKIRDMYDLYKLMQDPTIKQFFLSEEFKEGMFLTSMQDWLQHKRIHTQYPYANSSFFSQPEELLANKKVLAAYKDLEKLLFADEELPPISELTRLIQSMKPTIESFDLYKNGRKDEYVLAEFTAFFKEKPDTKIKGYTLISKENKPITRLCHITTKGKPYTLSLDYKTGDICKTKGTILKKDIQNKVWQTIDNKPAYTSENRIVSYKNKYLLQGIN